jgi:hypothetical protein
MRMRHASTVLLVTAACAASTPPPEAPGSRGPRASEHLVAAHAHESRARERASWPDTRPGDGTGRVDHLLIGTPWHRTWDGVADHERTAAYHRGAAGELRASFERACGARSLAEVSMSPLARFAIGGANIADGVVIYLAPEAGPPERLLADLDCHRAWMMLAPANMEHCPLDLLGLRADASGGPEGISVTLTVRDPALVPELQRRAAHELELRNRAKAPRESGPGRASPW